MTAITVTKQVLENGSRNYIASFTASWAASDTLTEYTAADPTSAGDMGVSIGGNVLYPGTHLKIWRLAYNIADSTVGLVLNWDASAKQAAWILSGYGKQNFMAQGGLYVPQSGGSPITGATGKILFDLLPASLPAGSFTVEMWLKKDIQQ